MSELYVATAGAWRRRADGAIWQDSADAFELGTTMPTADNTGVRPGTSLTTHVGDYTASVAGATISGLRIEGKLSVTAANVTVRDCEIVGTLTPPNDSEYNLVQVTNAAATGFVMEFCTINPRATENMTNGFRVTSVTLRRNTILNVVDHINLVGADDGTVIEGNYCAEVAYFTPGAPIHDTSDNQTHNDVIQFHNSSGNTGGLNCVSRGNRYVAKYGTAGTHQPSHKAGPSPSGNDTPSIAIFMFSPYSAAPADLGFVSEDDWFDGAYLPINSGGATGKTVGRIWRGKFDGDSADHDSNPATHPYTFLKSGATIDTGTGADVNTFYTGTFAGEAVTIR